MPIAIRCLEGPHAGKQIALVGGKPLQLEVRRQGGTAGMLAFAASPKGLMFTNSSPIESEVNGTDRRHAVLVHGDRVRVGKMLFEACLDGDLKALIAAAGTGKDETEPGLEALPEEATPAALDGKQSTVAYNRNGSARPQIMSEDPTPTAGNRSSRRISASRMAAVDLPEPQKEGLLSRVGKVFKRKEEGDQRLNELEDEREGLLQLAGRLALERLGGFGLPGNLLHRLTAGQEVTLRLEDMGHGARESYRRHCELLAYLDAEISARREELGLGPDPSLAAMRNIPLQTEHAERRESAFKAMDNLMTDEVQATTTMMQDAVEEEGSGEFVGGTQDDEPTPPGGSARRRAPRRRRR
jgi:hypothetical protein